MFQWGSTRHVDAAYQGTMPSLGTWLSIGKFVPSPIQSVPIRRRRFYLRRFIVLVTRTLLTHLRTGPPGVTGLMGSLFGRKTELGWLRAHLIIGPPFSNRKRLAAMSNAGRLVGDKRGRLCLQTLASIITPRGYVGDKRC